MHPRHHGRRFVGRGLDLPGAKAARRARRAKRATSPPTSKGRPWPRLPKPPPTRRAYSSKVSSGRRDTPRHASSSDASAQREQDLAVGPRPPGPLTAQGPAQPAGADVEGDPAGDGRQDGEHGQPAPETRRVVASAGAGSHAGRQGRAAREGGGRPGRPVRRVAGAGARRLASLARPPRCCRNGRRPDWRSPGWARTAASRSGARNTPRARCGRPSRGPGTSWCRRVSRWRTPPPTGWEARPPGPARRRRRRTAGSSHHGSTNRKLFSAEFPAPSNIGLRE